MSTHQLSKYLNDHLAGSVAALELLGHVISSPAAGFTAGFEQLRADIEEDQETLEGIIAATGEPESTGRKAAAWLAEKAGRLKLQLRGSEEEPLELLEAIETIHLGIVGKLGLWDALAQLSESTPGLAGVDFQSLAGRAAAQAAIVEQQRLAAAQRAFALV